ncbi:MAG: ATP-grasp domain-containing protein, partial [Alphaproteobacteria bacterium]
MFLLEHDAKTLLAATGARVPDGVLLTSSDITSDDLPAPGPWVVKAQVTAGGRGKAGGIALADTPDAVQREAQRILGLEIKGKKVDSVRIEKQVSGASEHYLGFILDPGASGVQVLFSAEGGVDIEDGADQLRSTIAAPNEAAMVKAAVELSADQSDA